MQTLPEIVQNDAAENVLPGISGKEVVWFFALFLATLFTTLLTGALQEGGDPFHSPGDYLMGIPFSFTLMSILLVHEMGHYLTSKRYGIKTSLPYFIPGLPFPLGIGTFGAFIKVRGPILWKGALMDIGAAGPIAGFVLAVIAVVIGIDRGAIVPDHEMRGTLQLGEPLIFSWLATLLGKGAREGYHLAIGPIGFAGWIGLFVTSLNLLPIGQLDGGHIVYALLGRKHRRVSIGMVILLIVMGVTGWGGWLIWAGIAMFFGIRHPPAIDEDMRLDARHRWIGWVSIILFVLTFTPTPFKI